MNHKPPIFLLLLMLGSCGDAPPATQVPATQGGERVSVQNDSPLQAQTPKSEVVSADPERTEEPNPLFQPSPLYLQYPPFDRIREEHYLPAFQRGMEEEALEVAAIANQAAEPTFDNTIRALEVSGQLLARTASVFYAMSSAHTNDQHRAIEQQIAPQLSAHEDSILLNPALFQRIQTLYERRAALGLYDESTRLIERYYSDFVRAGAALTPEQQQRLRQINGELASLQTRFSQNVLSEANDLAIVVDSREELSGMRDALIQAAAAEAEQRGLPGKFVIPLLNTSGQPALAYLQNRALRERILRTSLSRGSRGGEFDNRQIMTDVLRLRAERARLLGFDSHADYSLAVQTAQTVTAVNQRLAELAPPAAANARAEARALQEVVDARGDDFRLAPWDWEFYAERLSAERFDFDADQLKPYLALNNVLNRGLFYAAEQLYGLRFEERFDLPVYQEDVRVFEVFDPVGTTLGIFIADFYARPSKRGGAWMNAYVNQSELFSTQPIVAIHLNITEPADGEPTLLTFDEVTTMFHEFGHALHGLFSSVRYPYFAGTRVPRDFVEYPSQVNEMWATWPQVLANYAVHVETGEPMPAELLDSVLASQSFNQGFSTVEYLAAAVVDQALHQLAPEQVPSAEELMAFEHQSLESAGLALNQVPPRYRATYFSHIMGGYAAGYYSYIWSEVLDADTVEWFRENGGLRRENGEHFRQTLLSKGGSVDAMELYRRFRGRDAEIEPLLKRRGLL